MPERVGWNRNDELSAFSTPLVLELAKQGLLGMQIEPRYGGLGLGHSEVVRVLEQLAALDLGLCLFIALNNALGMLPIAGHADEKVKQALLPQLVTGTAFAGFAFMEPGGGNTPHTFSAVARSEANGRWSLFGTKCLHGQSQRASVVNVFVRHEESPAVSAFVIDTNTSGLHVADDGLRRGVMAGLAQDTVVFDGVLVSSGNLLGNVGGGMEVARQAMLQTRLAVGAACLGMMKRCAQLARRYSPYSGRIHGKLTPNPVTLSRFGSLAARVTTLETLVQRIASAMDEGRTVPAEAFAICKIAGPDLLLRAADDLMQLGAQRGADEMKRLSLLYGQAGFLRTLDGPPEPVSELIGALLMEEEGRSLTTLISTILRAPEALELLDRIVHSLRERLHRSPGALTRRAQRWSHTRAGELVTWVVLVAAVDGARSETPTAELARAATWARAQFEFALSTMELSTPSELAALEAPDVSDAFAAYAHNIGDLTDDAPREPADTPPPMGYWEPLSGINPARTAQDVPPSRSPLTRSDLNEFVVTWLSQRVRLPVSKIDGSRSFADHGLDSIASVELAKALSDRLGVALDETLLWNFATIDELLDHLIIEAGPPRATQRDPQDSPLTAELDAEITRLELELRRR
jgi:alkylation response protein AidB-like acyl-CoA dehydrogenase/acyl carrier protein